jgi:hypothetical protein
MSEEGFNDIVLWRDTAPDESVFVCHAKKTAELRIWKLLARRSRRNAGVGR